MFVDSKLKIPELIIKSFPDVIFGENGNQNQSIYHMLRYREVLVKIITHRLKIASILPIGRDVLSPRKFSIPQEINENTISNPGSIRNVISTSTSLEN